MGTVRIPRLLVAGTHSGVGKTTVTIGLIQAFVRRGWRVQPFKAGPDYIDPGYHSQVAGCPCRTLDTWLIPSGRLPLCFAHACRGADVAVVEGVMGLYDGIGATGEKGSTAELAKILGCPVLLVVDAAAISRSAAAVVRGFVDLDRKVPIAGCLVNRLAGEGHYRLVKSAVEQLTGIPVLGWLPRDPGLHLPERHLGLVPAIERRDLSRVLRRLEHWVIENFDLAAIRRIAQKAKPFPLPSLRAPQERSSPGGLARIPIAIAQDEAFHFYYPENLELLKEFGAEVVPFSPLRSRRLPPGVGGLYLGGGFPEIFARELSRNRLLHRSIREAVSMNLPAYAECGGLMVLTRSLRDGKGRRYPMIGLLPADVRMTDRLQNFGYKQVCAQRKSLLAQRGERARGHEFHHSVCKGFPARPTAAYEVSSVQGGDARLEGYTNGSLLASYVHLHFWSQPRWAERFVQAARIFKNCQKERNMRRMALAFGMSLVTSLVWVNGGMAAEETTRFREVVVTATKAKTPAKNVTRAVSVIPGEKLSVVQGGFASLGLSDVPETLVRRSGSIGRTTAVVIRGASAPQVHVNIDGAHVASPTTGSFDFNHLTPDNLERMEVLRGPHSTLYGSDAMGGVINLVTRRGEGPFRASYTQEGGMEETTREVASFQGAAGPWHLSGSASRMDSEGRSQNDGYQNTNLSTRVGYDFSDQTRLDFSLRHLFAIVGIDDGPFRPDPNRKTRERQTIASGRFETSTAPWWSQSFRLSSSIGKVIDSDPSDRSTQANSFFKLSTGRYGAEWMNRFTPVEWDAVTLGVEYEERQADNHSFSKAQSTRAVYLQNQWRPADPLTVVTGARFFRESSFGSDQVLDASAAYFAAPWNLKLRGGWGQGFRVPSLNDLFFPNFGNPNLSAEKSETYEMGAEQVLWDERLNWSGTLFRTNYKDLIQIVRVNSTTSQPQNVGRARIDGAELEMELRPVKPWVLQGSYTHLEANERPSGEELLRIPKNTVGFSIGLDPKTRWELRLDGLLVSSREESTGTNSRNKTKGYLKLDLFAQCRFKNGVKGYLRVDNLTNERYSEVLGFPASGTIVSVGVTLER